MSDAPPIEMVRKSVTMQRELSDLIDAQARAWGISSSKYIEWCCLHAAGWRPELAKVFGRTASGPARPEDVR
jgi:hypothetical protein